MIETLSRYIKSSGKNLLRLLCIFNWYEQDKDKLSQKKNDKIPPLEEYDKEELL